MEQQMHSPPSWKWTSGSYKKHFFPARKVEAQGLRMQPFSLRKHEVSRVYLLIVRVKPENSFLTKMTGKITISDGRLAMRSICMGQPCPFKVPKRLLCSQFKTISCYTNHPCFLFHTVLSLLFFPLKIPVCVHNHSHPHVDKSISVKAQVPTWVRFDEPVWTSENPHSLLS